MVGYVVRFRRWFVESSCARARAAGWYCPLPDGPAIVEAKVSAAPDAGRFGALPLTTIGMATVAVTINRTVWRPRYRLEGRGLHTGNKPAVAPTHSRSRL